LQALPKQTNSGSLAHASHHDLALGPDNDVPEIADYPCAAVPRHFIRLYWGFFGKITAATKMKIKPRKNSKPAPPRSSFNAQKFPDTAGIFRKVMEYRGNESIYSPG
jgi:hypothetical protein